MLGDVANYGWIIGVYYVEGVDIEAVKVLLYLGAPLRTDLKQFP